MDIEIWTQKEAEEWFTYIEKSNGQNESEIIDWKEEPTLSDTGFNKNNDTNNTLQRAMSGFANTMGGSIVLGFSRNGELKGLNYKDLENKISRSFRNRKNTNLFKIKFKLENYTYKNKNIPIIFIKKSKEPIQCDNGVFYYREQTEFLPIPYYKLENKFKEYFDELKYLDLTIKELELLKEYVKNMPKDIPTLNYKFDHNTKIIHISPEKLYNLYNKNNLWDGFVELIKLINIWIVYQENKPIYPANQRVILEKINHFYNDLKKIKDDL